MWISLYTFLEKSLFLSVTRYDTTQIFFTILTMWTTSYNVEKGNYVLSPLSITALIRALMLYTKVFEKIVGQRPVTKEQAT